MCLLPFIGAAYDALGDVDSTIAVLERYVSATWLSRINVDVVSLVPALERLARNYERSGDRQQAARQYARIVALWSDADPELQGVVTAARRAVQRLSRDDAGS